MDAWVSSPANWDNWQEYWPGRNDFNRSYIFSLMNFHPESDAWLFGGIYRVISHDSTRYWVELTNEMSDYIGRLKISYSYKDRSTRVNLENHYRKMVVAEVLSEPYGGRHFPGLDTIDLSFSELENIVVRGKPDWMQALANAKGIYMITDTSTQKRYIGSAYGDRGVWSR